ncbi:MAG: helix-turn-helix domain-containing protein [Gammaproteobacteria bacterium]|nr:helix-turn-helix domain-containing protein [Gammaproteobacteria bacterium]
MPCGHGVIPVSSGVTAVINATACGVIEIPRTQRCALIQPLADFEWRYDRKEAMARAYLSGQHTMAAIAQHFDVHYTTVSRIVNGYENSTKT